MIFSEGQGWRERERERGKVGLLLTLMQPREEVKRYSLLHTIALIILS